MVVNGKLLMYLRDNKPDLFHANMWDFLGGGREGKETPFECVFREIKEEIDFSLSEKSIIWQKVYLAQKDKKQQAVFMVVKADELDVEKINLTEGQKCRLFTKEEFFGSENVIPALKERFSDYLNEYERN